MILNTSKLCSDEVERNRRKVMEINFFLDSQQISFDNRTSDMQVNISETLSICKTDANGEKSLLEQEEEKDNFV